MIVALIHHYSLTFYAGGEKVILDIARCLSKRGHSVEVYSLLVARRLDREEHVRKILDELGVHYEEVLHKTVRGIDVAYYIYAPLLHRFINARAPRIAGIHSAMYAIGLQHDDVRKLNAISFLKRFGLIRTLSRYWFEVFGGRELRSYEVIHVVSPAMRDLVEHPRVYCIPNGIDLSKFRLDLSRKRGKFTALFVGRREWAKGFDLFLKASELLSDHSDIEFLAVGPSIGRVRGLGFVDDGELPKVYAESHVVVYPSRIDTQGLVILEALASGTPVITTPIPAHTAMNLPVLYASTPEEIAKRILELKDEWEKRPEDYLRRCELGRRAAERFDLERACREFEKMLVEVANGS